MPRLSVKKNNNRDIENDPLPSDGTPEDIRELEGYIREFSVFLPMPFCLATPADVIIDINNAFKKLSGYDEADIIGQRTEDFFGDKRGIRGLLASMREKGEARQKEIGLIAKNGDVISVSVSVALRRDANKDVIGYFLALSDITDLKKLQDSLENRVRARTKELEEVQKVLIKALADVKSGKEKVEAERNKTAAIISNFFDPVMVVDNDWRVILINPEARRVFGLDDNDLGGKVGTPGGKFSFDGFRDIIKKTDFSAREIETDDNDGPLVEEVIVPAAGEKRSEERKEGVSDNPFAVGMTKYNRGERVYKVMTAPVCDEASVRHGYMKIFYDLTREKMIDMLKSEFISIAAHQLRTPLSAIKWSIKMVLDGDAGKLNEEQEKILLNGYVSNERTINLINEMLHVSNIEEGRFGFRFKNGDIAKVVKAAINDRSDAIKSKKIRLIEKIARDLPAISMDSEKMGMAAGHLLENAVKYTPESGTITVGIGYKRGKIEMIIRDNGVGIPAKDQNKLFTKFFRADNVVRMQTEGSGLGLFIVKNIVNEHGGTVSCASEEGRGTEIRIRLPVNRKIYS